MSVLTNSTGGGLGLAETQAAGGLGSVMSLASSKLPAADYAALGEALPSADKFIAAAQNAGVHTNSITDVEHFNSAMRKLGITPDKTSRMLGEVRDYVAKVGGTPAESTLASLWK